MGDRCCSGNWSDQKHTSSSPASKTSANSESDALLKLKESLNNTAALYTWELGTDPCAPQKHWNGIICENSVVSGLRLGNLGLSGTIDADALVNLKGLRSIALTSNSFLGPIPSFHRMGALKGLYISNNGFSGEIPSDFFTSMAGLKKVWFSGNNFSGPIPSSVVQLSHLMELHLDNNKFSGGIPNLQQKNLVSVNFSGNNLEGEIPSGLSKFGAEAFVRNDGLCGGIMGKVCDNKAMEHSALVDDYIEGNLLGGVAVGVLLLLIVCVIVFMSRLRRNDSKVSEEENAGNSLISSLSIVGRKQRPDPSLSTNRSRLGSNRIAYSRDDSASAKDLVILSDVICAFGMSDLMKASAEVVGIGTLGSSYKATMVGGLTVVVKRIKDMGKMGKDKFGSEIKKLASLRHRNVLPPIAYHYLTDEKLFITLHQKKGSLLFALHSDRGLTHAELTWPVRLKIIQGIARGLGYLHKQLSSLNLPHGSLKSSNVLLGPQNEPVLVDYGFCLLLSNVQAEKALSAYKCPEAILNRQVSPKCDVYCFGIIILEVLTGKFPSQYETKAHSGTDLVQWVRSSIVEGRESSLIDLDILTNTNYVSEIVKLLHVGASCTESVPDERLDLEEAIRRVNEVCIEGRN